MREVRSELPKEVINIQGDSTWEWGLFTEADFDRLPETTIPSLKNREAFAAWLQSIRASNSALQADVWIYSGDRGYKKELESLFGQQLFDHCKKILERKRKLKMVSFGGAQLQGVLELRKMLEADQEEKVDIQIVDFSLTREAGESGAAAQGSEDDLRSGAILLRSGLLQIRDIEDAEGADVMISTHGPFVYESDERRLPELVEKVGRKLAPGGRAFLETLPLGVPTPKGESLVRAAQDALGDDFIVSSGHNDQHAGFFDILRRNGLNEPEVGQTQGR